MGEYSMTPFDNKRRHRRFTVDVMEITGNAVFASKVVLTNISITGVSLITDRKPETGREYSLRIMDNDLDMTITGTVIWSENMSSEIPGSSELKYAAGLQFRNLDPKTMQSLVAFMEMHLVEKHKQIKVNEMNDCRCNIRFDLDRKETAVMNIDEIYRVTKLSLGGLLMESSQSLEPEVRLHMGITIGGTTPISFTGRVVSCVMSADNASRFEIAIEFVGMPEPDRLKLKEFIRKLYLDDAGFSVS